MAARNAGVLIFLVALAVLIATTTAQSTCPNGSYVFRRLAADLRNQLAPNIDSNMQVNLYDIVELDQTFSKLESVGSCRVPSRKPGRNHVSELSFLDGESGDSNR